MFLPWSGRSQSSSVKPGADRGCSYLGVEYLTAVQYSRGLIRVVLQGLPLLPSLVEGEEGRAGAYPLDQTCGLQFVSLFISVVTVELIVSDNRGKRTNASLESQD